MILPLAQVVFSLLPLSMAVVIIRDIRLNIFSEEEDGV